MNALFALEYVSLIFGIQKIKIVLFSYKKKLKRRGIYRIRLGKS